MCRGRYGYLLFAELAANMEAWETETEVEVMDVEVEGDKEKEDVTK